MDVDDDMDFLLRPQPRSVSDPLANARARLNMTQSQTAGSALGLSMSSRREGFGLDTSKSLVGLSEALEKLKMRKAESGPRSSLSSGVVGGSAALSPGRRRTSEVLMDAIDQVPVGSGAGVACAVSGLGAQPVPSSRLSAVHRPRHSLFGGDTSMSSNASDSAAAGPGDKSVASLMTSTAGTSSRCLKGVVAFVDVRTDEGAGAGDIWGEMLKGLGAKVGVACLDNILWHTYSRSSPA